jgi:hypothetical protein
MENRTALLMIVLIGAISAALLYLSKNALYFAFSSPELHFVLELFVVLIGAAIAYVAGKSFLADDNVRLLFLSLGFGIGAFFDILHGLAFPGMPSLLVQASTNNSLYFWYAARLVTGIFFLLAMASPLVRISKASRERLLAATMLAISVFALALSLLLIQANVKLFYIEGTGLTPLKVFLEYASLGFYVLAFAVGLRAYLKGKNKILQSFAAGLVLLAFSQVAFTIYSLPTDSVVWLGHILRVAAYVMIGLGLRSAYRGER